MFNWLKRKKGSPAIDSLPTQPGSRVFPTPDPVVQREKKEEDSQKPINLPAQDQLHRYHDKLDSLAKRFASGNINRVQFQELFNYYQTKIHELETILSFNPESDEWKKVVNEGQSLIIRRKYAAKLNGFSIVDHRNGMPLRTIGEFGLDPALFVPMLYAYQSATKEIFGGEAKLTQIEDGRWLVFVSGISSTTIAMFSTEPSQQQLTSLRQIHNVFETANEQRLKKQPVDADALICPHEYFLTHAL